MKKIAIYLMKAGISGLLLALVIVLCVPALRYQGQQILLHAKPDLAPKMSFAYAAGRAAPAVVNIYTRSFQQGGLAKGAQLAAEGLGSGVIMTARGHILTNYHVVANADQIIVALQDGRIFAAQMVGGDLLTDLVVLKIDAEDLPVIPRSDEMLPQVGDVVLAIGNPYNVGQTVTQGIIGATGRAGMSSTRRQDFLQTDAAINRGNSGGALVNTRGELVGINTSAFLAGDTHETYGISFAIPCQLAVRIMESLIRDGKVTRGYLGLDGLDLSPSLASMWNLGDIRGVIVKDTDPNGPAAKAGVIANDIILKVGEQQIEGVKQAMDLVAETAPETVLPLTLLRDGKLMVLPVTVEELVVKGR